MKRDGCPRHMMEEETKVRKNLSRLIHTVQHMPSARYRRDATSLWNLVDEIESFQPPNSSGSANCSQKPARTSFSRKYLDLRLYPSREISSSPESHLKNQQQNKKPQTLNSNKSKKNKKTEVSKKDTEQNAESNTVISQDKRAFNKTKSDLNKICKENVSPENDKDKKRSSIAIQLNPDLKGSHLNQRTKLFQSKRKSEGTGVLKKNNSSSEQLHRETVKFGLNKENRILTNDKRYNYNVISKTKGFNSFGYIKNKSDSSKQFNEALGKAYSVETPLENDKASMVKKLTSYWNNLLSNDVDDNDLSSSQDSTDDPQINKSLQDLARNIYQKAGSRTQDSSLSGDPSEASINIPKDFNGFNATSDVLKNQNENKNLFFEHLSKILSNTNESNIKHKKCSYSKEELFGDGIDVPPSPYLLDMCCGDNHNVKVVHNSGNNKSFEPSLDLKAHHAIAVMEKLIGKLKRFCELSLTSDKITLPHSLRTMLCLMTATVLSSEEQVFDDLSDPEVIVEIKDDENSNANLDPCLSSGCIKLSDDPLAESLDHIENCSTKGVNDNLQLVALEGTTLRKVEDALKYLALCKDFIWTEFLLNSRFDEDNMFYQSGTGHSPRSFTFVIEEELLLEEDSDEDESYDGNESEYDGDESSMEEVYKSAFDSASISLESLVDLAADMVLHFWPDSFQDFVKTMYQTLVSLLVWWIIAKEIFLK